MATQLEKDITKVHTECWAKGTAELWKVDRETGDAHRVSRFYPDYWPSYQAIRQIEARLASQKDIAE